MRAAPRRYAVMTHDIRTYVRALVLFLATPKLCYPSIDQRNLVCTLGLYKMPLVKRTVEPIYIGRAPLEKSVKNELEGVVVNSLAGVIKQLSSLSKHAENLFGDLISEANNLYTRSATLNQRVQVLYEKTSQLDSAVKGDGEA